MHRPFKLLTTRIQFVEIVSLSRVAIIVDMRDVLLLLLLLLSLLLLYIYIYISVHYT